MISEDVPTYLSEDVQYTEFFIFNHYVACTKCIFLSLALIRLMTLSSSHQLRGVPL